MKRKKGLDIVRRNDRLKEALIARFSELFLTNKDICNNAKAMGFVIQESALSRYLGNTEMVVGSLTQEQILWLCCRYCVPIKIDIIRMPYNKDKAKQLLTKFFG